MKNGKDEFKKLNQLLEQDQFEWLPDGRVVYIMNDAVESFLVFENARMTGNFDTEYDGPLSARLEELDVEPGETEAGETGIGETNSGETVTVGTEYLLVVRQGQSNTFTVRFTDLKLEVHLYNYGEIGHFWVDGQEDIRQLEYRLAIMKDKIRYLGNEYANAEEMKLVRLAEFPPIMTYYAVPLKYIDVPKEPWNVTSEAIREMKLLAAEAHDESLARLLAVYQRCNQKVSRKHGQQHSATWTEKMIGRYIAKALTHKEHVAVLELLAEKIKHATTDYPDRTFGEPFDEEYQALWNNAKNRAAEMKAQGQQVTALREEPFVEAPDDLSYKVYLMKVDTSGKKKVVEVEKVQK